MKKYVSLVSAMLCYQVIFCQNVGVNTPTPEATLDINGDIIIRTTAITVADGITLALDVNTTRFSYYRVTGPTADFTLAGITAGIDGRLLTLFNRSGFTMQLNNEDATAAVTDMIVTGTNADMIIANKGIVNLQYDGTEQKWIVRSSSKGGVSVGGGFWNANGNNISNANTGNVGIGTVTPLIKLSVQTGTGNYGITHTDGTITVGTYIGNGKGWLGTKSNHPLTFFANNSNELMTLLPSGNLGIGTTTPGAPLSYPNTLGNKISFWRAGPNNDFGIGINTGVMQLYTAGTDKIAFGYGNANAFNEKIAIETGSGLLRYPNVTGNKISFWRAGPNNDFGIGINAGVMQLYTAGTDKIAFGYGNANAFIEKITFLTGSGQVGLGTTNIGTYQLAVNGNIRSKEVVVENGWADYVFEKKYQLPLLSEVEKFIQQNNHLPNIPSAAEVEKNGLHLGDIQKRMMEKIEELTLYIIDLNKEINFLKKEITTLKQ
jgi:hypothetical protein